MKIEIESNELLEILTGLNQGMFDKIKYIVDAYEEQFQTKSEDDLKWNVNAPCKYRNTYPPRQMKENVQ